MSEAPEHGKTEHASGEPPGVTYRRKLALARAAIVWERLWTALWPAAAVAAGFVALALSGVLPMLPAWLHALVLAAFAIAVVGLAWRGLAGLRLPDVATARRRLELASGLPHRPLQTLSDRLADGVGDAEAQAVWRLHLARMAELARRIRVGPPRPGVAARDPMAVRFAVLLLVVVAATAGWPDAGDRLRRALVPEFSPFAATQPPKLDIWITPPAYTGLAPIFPQQVAAAAAAASAAPSGNGAGAAKPGAAAAKGAIAVPAGSELTVRLASERSGAHLVLADKRLLLPRVDARNAAITTPVVRSGRLAVELEGRTLGEWTIEVVKDKPPTIAFATPPAPTERKTLAITYSASDDYGLQSVAAEMRRTYERGEVVGKEVEELPLTLPGPGVKTARETSYHDLTPHRWAGLPITMRLRAKDSAGQVSYSDDVKLVLPEREFRNPVARAIIEQRKRLTTEPERRESIVERLGEIMARPGTYDNRITTFLALSAARGQLIHDPTDEALSSVRDLLWDTALGVEDGQVSIAERELRRAEQALTEALARNAPDAELERLMDDLQRALNRFMQQLAQQLRNQPAQQAMQFDPHNQLLEATDLQRMLQQIRDLMRAGARDAARQLLAQLQNMLENLRAGRSMQMDPQTRAGNQALQQLQDLIRRQNELMDRTFRQSQRRGGPPQSGESRQGAMTQRQLQEALAKLREMLRKMGMQPGQADGPGRALDQADQNMGESARALDRNAPGQSVGPQGQAIDALQRAGRGVVQQMMQQMGQRNGMGLTGRFNPLQQRRDPLGRYMQNDQGLDTQDVVVPDEGAVERAQRILQELRRRAGQHYRPQYELDYIHRLLRQF